MRPNPLPFLLVLMVCLPIGAQNLREKGDLLIQEGHFDEAKALGLAALLATPADTDASILVCESFLGLKRPEDAANYAAKAWGFHQDPRIAALLGEAYFDIGRNDEALTWLRFYLAAQPEGARAGEVYYLTGEIYLRLGRYGHADMAIASAIYFSPGKASWWSRLGWAQEKAGDLRQALKSYESALAIDPGQADAAIGRQRILRKLRG